MPSERLDAISIGPLGKSDLPEALELLFSHVAADERPSHITAASNDIAAGAAHQQILLAARRNQSLIGAVWLQIRPGHVAALHAPALVRSETDATAVALIESAVSQAFAAGVRFVQTLSKTDTGPEAQWLVQAHFQHIADLLYLVSLRESFSHSILTSELAFHPLDDSPAAMARLSAIIEQTYQGSQDCPTIHGLQPASDALASYRAASRFDPTKWFIVTRGPADVGCLLLAENHGPLFAAAQWELIYMGVVPEARGKGLGIEIVRHAQQVANDSSADRLILAVDAANAPAIAAYSAVRFQAWDRRSVFLRTK